MLSLKMFYLQLNLNKTNIIAKKNTYEDFR